MLLTPHCTKYPNPNAVIIVPNPTLPPKIHPKIKAPISILPLTTLTGF